MPARVFVAAFIIGITALGGGTLTYWVTRERVHVINVRGSLASQKTRSVMFVRGTHCSVAGTGKGVPRHVIFWWQRRRISGGWSTSRSLRTQAISIAALWNFPDPRFGETYTWAAYRLATLRRPAACLRSGWLHSSSPWLEAAITRRACARCNVSEDVWRTFQAGLTRHPRLSLRDPAMAISFAGLCVLPVAMHAYLGTFTRLMADDYCFASAVRRIGVVHTR